MEEIGLSDYLAILRRWKTLFIATTATLVILSSLFCLHWSNYRATAVVQVESPEIASNTALPLGMTPKDEEESEADRRINEIAEKVLSTSSLIDVITKFNLYPAARQNVPIAGLAAGMRKKIQIALIDSDISGAGSGAKSSTDMPAIAFTLSFDYKTPLIAQQVTDDLVTRFLDEDLKEKRAETESTSAFLATQIKALEQSMAEQEQKIADYEKKNGVTRPEDLAFNQQAAETLTLNLQNLDSQITQTEGAIGNLRAQLAGVDPYSRVIADGQVLTSPAVELKALQAQYDTLTAQYGPNYPDVVKTRHQIDALQAAVGGHVAPDIAQLQAQINDLKTNIAAAEKTYGPNHPDVVSLNRQLQHLEDDLARHKPSPENNGDGIVADADNPAYLQISLQVRAAENQLATLQAQRAQLAKQQAQYQKAVMQNPQAQEEMASLTRDYDNAQLRYRELKEKKMSADMELQMQQDRKGARLTLIDPPELPGSTHPRKIVLFIAGFMLSFMGGIASVAAAQIIRKPVVGAASLESVVGVAPLISIPHIYTREERDRARSMIYIACDCVAGARGWVAHRFTAIKSSGKA
ncbi:MAG: hypothetical protein KGI37_04430 [Alphaproteobacteria bacterium]|nr:hypothetical protein [Alphaproteobacteria bacterium]